MQNGLFIFLMQHIVHLLHWHCLSMGHALPARLDHIWPHGVKPSADLSGHTSDFASARCVILMPCFLQHVHFVFKINVHITIP